MGLDPELSRNGSFVSSTFNIDLKKKSVHFQQIHLAYMHSIIFDNHQLQIKLCLCVSLHKSHYVVGSTRLTLTSVFRTVFRLNALGKDKAELIFSEMYLNIVCKSGVSSSSNKICHKQLFYLCYLQFLTTLIFGLQLFIKLHIAHTHICTYRATT